MNIRKTCLALGRAQLAIGGLILITTLLSGIIYGPRLQATVSQSGETIAGFGEQLDTTAAILEQNQQQIERFVVNTNSYKDTVKSFQSSIKSASRVVDDVDASCGDVIRNLTDIAKVVDTAGDRMLALKLPGNFRITKKAVAGVEVPTGIDFDYIPFLKDEGETAKGIAKSSRDIASRLSKASEDFMPKFKENIESLNKSCHVTVELIAGAQDSAQKAGTRDLPKLTGQMRESGRALRSIGGNLETLGPLVWVMHLALALLGALLIANGYVLTLMSKAAESPDPNHSRGPSATAAP